MLTGSSQLDVGKIDHTTPASSQRTDVCCDLYSSLSTKLLLTLQQVGQKTCLNHRQLVQPVQSLYYRALVQQQLTAAVPSAMHILRDNSIPAECGDCLDGTPMAPQALQVILACSVVDRVVMILLALVYDI
jgi:hypothetical protein